jgi:plasmid stability protein
MVVLWFYAGGGLTMATITLKNLPDDLHHRLKERAAKNRRSLNSEVIACLEEMAGPASRRAEDVLSDVKAFRKKLGGHLTERQLNRYKREGRL